MILVEVLILVHGVVRVDILCVGSALVGSRVALSRLARVGRVALGRVDEFVSVEDRSLSGIVVAAAEIVVVIAGRVVVQRVEDSRSHLALHLVEIVGIDAVCPLVGVSQTIETDVLLLPCAALVGERVDYRLLAWHASPHRFCVSGSIADRHAALVVFLSVLENVLADVAEVDVEVTAIALVILSVDERIHHPELDILHIGIFEVTLIDASHHAAPSLLRAVQTSVVVHVGVKVVGATLLRIVGEVEHAQRVALSLIGVAVGVHLSHVHLSHIVVGELVEVTLYVAWRERRGASCKERVDVIPCQARTVIAVAHIVRQLAIFEVRGGRGEHPVFRVAHVGDLLVVVEVIEIRCTSLRLLRLACVELSIFAREGYGRGSRQVEQRYLVEHVGQPLRVLLPVEV